MALTIFIVFFLCTSVLTLVPSYLDKCEINLVTNLDSYCKDYVFNNIDCFPWLTEHCLFNLNPLSSCIEYDCKVSIS